MKQKFILFTFSLTLVSQLLGANESPKDDKIVQENHHLHSIEEAQHFLLTTQFSPLALALAVGSVDDSGAGWTGEASVDSFIQGGNRSISVGPRINIFRRFYIRPSLAFAELDLGDLYSGPSVLLNCGSQWQLGHIVLGGNWLSIGAGSLTLTKAYGEDSEEKHKNYKGIFALPKFEIGYLF